MNPKLAESSNWSFSHQMPERQMKSPELGFEPRRAGYGPPVALAKATTFLFLVLKEDSMFSRPAQLARLCHSGKWLCICYGSRKLKEFSTSGTTFWKLDRHTLSLHGIFRIKLEFCRIFKL